VCGGKGERAHKNFYIKGAASKGIYNKFLGRKMESSPVIISGSYYPRLVFEI
jgi:hypothetical protein